MKLVSEKVVTAESTLKIFTMLFHPFPGIGGGQEEGYESRTIIVVTNGMYSKFHEELEDDGALLFGYISIAYLDIGGEHWYHSPHLIQEYGFYFRRKLCEYLPMEIEL